MPTRRSLLLAASIALLPEELLPAPSSASPADSTADRAALLSGVDALVAPGCLPGPLAVYGANAAAVVAGQDGDTRGALVACARWGRGRVLVLGHEGFLSPANRALPQNRRFADNALAWASGGTGAKPVRDANANTFAAALAARDKSHGKVKTPLHFPGTTDIIGCVRVDQDELRGTKARLIPILQAWVRDEGGGLIVAGPAWGWKQTDPGASLSRDHSGNRLLAPIGIGFADGTLPASDEGNWKVEASDDISFLHARAALSLLSLFAEGRARFKAGAVAQATRTVGAALDVMPDNAPFAREVARLTVRAGGARLPTAGEPVTDNQPFARLAILRQARQMEDAPASLGALRCASDFPGAIPANAPRVGRTIAVDTGVAGWHATGLYAPPGTVVRVAIPAVTVKHGIGVRIGSHTDHLTHLPEWKRFPIASVNRRLDQPATTIANPLGGAVFVDVPDECRLGTVAVQISGALEAPLFVRGKTSPDSWRTVRDAPGPWAELVGNRCALSVPSRVVRSLNDADALMTYWDTVCDACADLYALPRERKRPERYCTDVQISAGYMHSGYPIMTGLDVAARFVDLSVLTGADGNLTWGFYHELGHNHQKAAWTWEGCGEVTNNLFSLYGCEKFNRAYKDGAYLTAHPAVTPDALRKRWAAYEAAGKPYEQWTRDPFLALGTFIELRQAFGWEPFQKVFAQYDTLSTSALPRTDAEKRDQFMLRFSSTVGKNLGPLFTGWGIPTSAAARSAISSLPVYQPV